MTELLHTAFLVGACIELLGSLLAILHIPHMIAGARQKNVFRRGCTCSVSLTFFYSDKQQ
jgi:hypothetical protein